MDAFGCGLFAPGLSAMRKLIVPVVPGAVLKGGAQVPGTRYELDPVQAAFCIGAIVRWLDYNDTWLAAEWGHPSDNLGAILAVADWLGRAAEACGRPAPLIRDVLTAMIRAYQIQACWPWKTPSIGAGLDHVLLVRVASTAVVASLLGLTQPQIADAVSNAWIDGGAFSRLPARSPIPVPVKVGPRATQPAEPCGWRCGRKRASPVTRLRSPRLSGVFRTASFAAKP